MRRLLSLDETAEYLTVSPRFVRRLVAERRISYHKVGKYLRFDAADLDEWLDDVRVERIARRAS